MSSRFSTASSRLATSNISDPEAGPFRAGPAGPYILNDLNSTADMFLAFDFYGRN